MHLLLRLARQKSRAVHGIATASRINQWGKKQTHACRGLYAIPSRTNAAKDLSSGEAGLLMELKLIGGAFPPRRTNGDGTSTRITGRRVDLSASKSACSPGTPEKSIPPYPLDTPNPAPLMKHASLIESRHAQQTNPITSNPDQKVIERWRASFIGDESLVPTPAWRRLQSAGHPHSAPVTAGAAPRSRASRRVWGW